MADNVDFECPITDSRDQHELKPRKTKCHPNLVMLKNGRTNLYYV